MTFPEQAATDLATPGRGFPEGFSWGTATAAHQIEGGNDNNDWWAFELDPDSGCKEPSGEACDSWHRWPEDADLVESLGFDNYRFSVEWSRIEPSEGEFDRAALDHYRAVAEGLRERGLDAVVTLHHFTSPQWLSAKGGWEDPGTVDAFGRFCEVTAAALGDVATRFCTINEPNIVASAGFLMGMFPPGVSDSGRWHAVNDVFVAAHRRAVDVVRNAAPGVPVGLTLSMTDYQAAEGGEAQRDKIRRDMEDIFLEATEGDDFLGVQTYTRMLIGPDGWLGPQPGVPVVESMYYEYWPEALEACLRRAWEVTQGELPLLVTENGLGSDDDQQRIDYVHRALEGVLRAIDDGIEVGGYTYWSLLDNFEWAFGYGPRFGLVSVDRASQRRSPKPSAHWLGSIARENRLLAPPA
jgi:beta-glucosidase